MKGGECTDASGNPQLPTEDYSNPIQLSNLLDLTPGQDGRALDFASPELKNVREIVLEDIRQNWMALQNASPELQNVPEVIAAARQ